MLSTSLRSSAEEFQVILKINCKNTGKIATCILIPQARYFAAQYYFVSKNQILAKLSFTIGEISVQFFPSSKKTLLS